MLGLMGRTTGPELSWKVFHQLAGCIRGSHALIGSRPCCSSCCCRQTLKLWTRHTCYRCRTFGQMHAGPAERHERKKADLPVMKVTLKPLRYRSVYRSSMGCSAGAMESPTRVWSCMHANKSRPRVKLEVG